MATIKDVAKRAGVAISTVSAVINRSAPVSEDAIERVERAITEIGYIPHGAAQSLRSGQSRLIGLIVPDITNAHFAAVAKVVESVCLAAGYMAAVYSTSEDFDRESQILGMMRQHRVAGLIIIPTRSDLQHGRRLEAEIHAPTVLLDSYVDGLHYDVVKLDNVAAGRMATGHLLDLGHRRIAVTTGRENIATGEDRLAGYLAAHEERGVSTDPSLRMPGRFRQDEAYASTLAMMRRADRPTAIFSISNMMTLGVLQALRELRLSVPQDVSIVGIDDFEFAEILNPPPTVVAAPVAEMAKAAIEELLAEIGQKTRPTGRRQIFEPRLIERESTRRLPA